MFNAYVYKYMYCISYAQPFVEDSIPWFGTYLFALLKLQIYIQAYNFMNKHEFQLIQMNRLRMQDYKECCKEDSNGILALSDILNVIHDDNLKINKPMLIHLPILHDVDDDHAELVVFERSLEGNLSIWIVNDAIKCEPDGNCYTFRVTNVNNRYV